MNSSPIIARPMVYTALGWMLVAMVGFIFVIILCFPRAPEPQYPNAMTQLQALVFMPSLICLPGGLLLWLGYRVVVIADENGLRWKRGRVWQTLRWDEVEDWALLHDESSQKVRCLVTGRDGQRAMWDQSYSNQVPLKEFIALKMEAHDSVWPVRFVYGGENWLAKVGQVFAGLFWLIPIFVLARALWVDWATTWAPLPHRWVVMALVLIFALAVLWLVATVTRVIVARHLIEGRHAGESIELRRGELIWKCAAQTWGARFEEVQLLRERNGDWRFEMPQGSFVVERLVGWRLVLQTALEERASHLRFDDAEEESLHFGFDTRSNFVVTAIVLIFPVMAMAPVLSSLLIPNPDGGQRALNLWALGLLCGIPIIVWLFGVYTCKTMAYEVGEEGLWRQGLRGNQLMHWSDIAIVGASPNDGFVEGMVDGHLVRWALSPFLTVERPAILRRFIAERAPQAARRET